MKVLVRSALLAAACNLLFGCLVSERPLFDASNAAATPIAAGPYEACSGSSEDEGVECNLMQIELGDDGLYVFAVDDDRIETRFRELGAGDYAMQMAEGDDGFMYYWGRMTGDALTITMLWCSDLPRILVEKLVEDGVIETDDDYTTCTVKSQGAVVAAARSYATGEAVSDSWVELRPATEVQ